MINELINPGTLLAYTLVAISVLILRFDHDDDSDILNDDINRNIELSVELKPLNSIQNKQAKLDRNFYTALFNADRLLIPTEQTSRVSTNLVMIIS